MDTDAWNRLARKTKHLAFFFPSDPIVRSLPANAEIVHGRGLIVSTLFGLLVGSCFLLFVFLLPWNRTWLDFSFRLIFGTLGLLCAGGITAFFRRERISINPLSSYLRIEWGYPPFYLKAYDFPIDEVSIELVESSDARLKGKVHAGRTVLFLSTVSQPDSIITVGVSKSKDKLTAVYRQLAEWLEGSAKDNTLECVALDDGSEICFPRTSTGGGGASFRDSKLVYQSPETLAIKSVLGTRLFFFGFFACGLMALSVLPPFLRDLDGSLEIAGTVFLCSVIGSLFTYIGLAGMAEAFHTDFSADRRERMIRIRTQNWRLQRRERSIRFEELLGIQLLKDFDEGGEGHYMNYELNLVLKSPNGERITLMKNAKEGAVFDAAKELSEFLGGRLFDHRGKSAIS